MTHRLFETVSRTRSSNTNGGYERGELIPVRPG